jgi:hypothetical protein
MIGLGVNWLCLFFVTPTEASLIQRFLPIRPYSISYDSLVARWNRSTASGAKWFPWFRVYGPEKAILDKSWRLPDIEMIG